MTGPEKDSLRLGYETQDARAGRIFLIGGGLLALILVVLAIMWGLFAFFAGHAPRPGAPPSAMLEQNALPPEPRLQPNPVQDLKAFLASEDSVLTTYAWVAQNAGIARVPIDTAMKLALKQGFPVRQNASGERPR